MIFFNGWEGIARTLVIGVLAYLALILTLRISGKRTLSKMNAFDLIVTVALGSTLATILLSKDVALAEGVTAYLTLVGMQFLIAWLAVRSSTIRDLVKSQPRLLFFKGNFIDAALRSERVTQDEVIAAIRAQGIPQLDQVEAVVLETDGSFTTLQRAETGTASSLKGVTGFGNER